MSLTSDQQRAFDEFFLFLSNPHEEAFIIEGSAGCGKTYLVKEILDGIPTYLKTMKLIDDKAINYNIELTATTNKAAENFAMLSGTNVITIHSLLGLRVNTDYRTNVSTLTIKRGAEPIDKTILFIDEASYIDAQLLSYIFKQTKNCKIVFIGDPYQLAPIKTNVAPVFEQSFPRVKLTKVVRQADGSSITELATKFRETVSSGKFFKFKPDNKEVISLNGNEFRDTIVQEFTRTDWKHDDSKILAWTNAKVISYNHFVRDEVKSDPNLAIGDYATVNSYISLGSGKSFKTDQTVQITAISETLQEHGIDGKRYTLDHYTSVFMPNSNVEKTLLVKSLRKQGQIQAVAHIESTWADLRAVYACTINKSQGSTYNNVFIDVGDISRCNSGNQIARMLYVAVSRARNRVYLYGDLI